MPALTQGRNPVLQLDRIRFRYRADLPWAVDDISLSLNAGEIFGLLGPNGAGKSTLMALISGLLIPDSGTIRRDAAVSTPGGFALVPQDFAFYPMLSCRENLDCFTGVLGLQGELKQQRIAQAVNITALDGVLDKRAAECSGGLRRRLNLAIGLLGDPQLLLLDEPTVGVDPQSRAFLLDAVRGLRARGKTVIYTSHYMEEVQAISDRVAIIDQGRVLCCDTVAGLLAAQQQSLQVCFATPPTTAQLAQLNASLRIEAGEACWRIWPEDRQTLVQVLMLINDAGLGITQLHWGHRHLEDVFLQLTHRSLRD